MSEEIKYMSEEDIKNGIESGDKEILNGMINKTIKVGEAPVVEPEVDNKDEIESAPDLIDEPDTILKDEPKDIELPKADDEYERKMEAIRAARLKDKQLFEEEKQKAVARANELEEIKLKLERELEESRKAKEVKEENIQIKEDEIDDPLEPDYSKATRKKVAELEAKLLNTDNNSNNTELLSEIKELKQAWAEQQASFKAQRDKERIDRTYKEIEDFQSKNELFRTKKPIKDLVSSYKLLHSEVSDYVKSIDKNARDEDISRAINAIVRGTTPTEIKFRERAEKAGVIVPKEMDKFMQIADIADLKTGKQYNSVTGKLEDITDDEGNVVTYRSLEEAYKIANYDKYMTEVRKSEAKKYQEKKDRRDQSAVILDNSSTSSVEEAAEMDYVKVRSILDKDPNEIKKSPELMAEYKKARAFLKLS